MKKVDMRKALKFFEDNYVMINSLETKDEKGCTDKCLEILKRHVENIIPSQN